MKRELVLLSIVAFLIPLGIAAQDAAAEGIHVQASFYPYYDFTRNVAGSAATVEQFLPVGIGAHGWEPSISKSLSLYDTDVVVYNGLGIDSYLDQLAESYDLSHLVFAKASDGVVLISRAGTDGMIREALGEYEHGHYTAEEAVEAIEDILNAEEIREILKVHRSGDLTTAEALSAIQGLTDGGHAEHDGHAATEESDEHYGHAATEDIRDILKGIRDGHTDHDEGLEAIRDLVGGHGGHSHGSYDPHIWLDPVLAVQQVANIRDALVAVDPANAKTYQDNAAAYISQLDELHNEFATTLSHCRHDTVVVQHGAFAYLAERYGFEMVRLSSITGTSTNSTANIVEYVRANDIGYLMGDDLFDTRTLRMIAEEADAQLLILSPIEGVTIEIFESSTYLDKMRDNLVALKTALACQ